MSPGAFRQRWRQPRLATKLAVLIVGVSLLGVTVSFLLGTSVHRDQLIDATRRSADRLSRTVLAALEDGMLRHDRSMMATIMGAMGEYDVVAGAWVLNDEGRLYVGTQPETVAARSPAFPASLQAVLADADPSSGPTVLITDRDTLLSVQPLENTARCQTCHETDQAVLGHLVIELPLNDLQGQLAAALQPMAIATATAAYGETREAIFNFRASTRHAGEHWLTTLRAFADDCARRYGLDVRVETSGDRRAPTPDTETQLLLAVKEAVLNACRHAQARQVVVSVADGVEALQIRVTDNGTGFDPGSTHPPPTGTACASCGSGSRALVGGWTCAPTRKRD